MRDIITIPATVEEVDTAITGAMEVFTLGEWPLAAWLASRVRLTGSGGNATSTRLLSGAVRGQGHPGPAVQGHGASLRPGVAGPERRPVPDARDHRVAAQGGLPW